MANGIKFKYDVFISYSRLDEPWATRLTTDLTGRGFSVFQDTERLRLGEEWEPQLADSLRKSQHLVILWSKHAGESKWVTAEQFYFRNPEDSSATGRQSYDRLMIPLVLEEPPSAGDSFQKLKDPALVAAYPNGAAAIDAQIWNGVIGRIEKAIGAASPDRPVPLAILAMTQAELAALTPTTRSPYGPDDLATVLRQLGLPNLGALQASDRYGASRNDWKPFGGGQTIWAVLDDIKNKLNTRTNVQRFRWMPVEEVFWVGSVDEFAAEAVKLESQRPSVIVIDPVSLFAIPVSSRLPVIKDCFRRPDCLILTLAPFAMPTPGVYLRELSWKLGFPYLTTYGDPATVAIEPPFASCFINVGDSDEVKRLLRLGLGVQAVATARPEAAAYLGVSR
jgi:TIR domain